MDKLIGIFIIISLIYNICGAFISGFRSIKFHDIDRFDNIFETVIHIITSVSVIYLADYYITSIS